MVFPPLSVDDVRLPRHPERQQSGGTGHALHGMGREDLDARCLSWRPFVAEVESPRKRKLDLEKVQKEVNATGKVEVSALRYSDKNEVRAVKHARPEKTYRLLVEFEKAVKKWLVA